MVATEVAKDANLVPSPPDRHQAPNADGRSFSNRGANKRRSRRLHGWGQAVDDCATIRDFAGRREKGTRLGRASTQAVSPSFEAARRWEDLDGHPTVEVTFPF